MKNPRVLVAGLFHETHTFLRGETCLDDCAVALGNAVLALQGDASPLGGALETARELNWDIVPALDVRAMPGPICRDEVVEFWWHHLEAALQKRPDAVFLVLHGAMVSRSFPDVEGELLERIRALVGPDIAIGGVTDLHANFSLRMARSSDCLVAYRENPHTDARETAQRAARLLDFLMLGDERAQTHFRQIPLLWPPTGTGTGDEPMRGLETLAREIEHAHAEILAVNVHAGYSFSDVRDAGVSFSVVSVGQAENAELALDKLEKRALQNRELGNVIEPSFASLLPSIRALLRQPHGGPVVLAEPSDNIGGGARGDGTGLLRALIEAGIGRSALILNDAGVVQTLSDHPIGAKIRLAVGGSNFQGAESLELPLELLSRSDGKWDLEDENSHLAAMFGRHIDMGPCATLRYTLPSGEAILLVLTSRAMPPFDLGQLRSQGVEPEKMALIGVKAAVAHRRAYGPIARVLLSVATPGPCASDLKTLPFQRVRRPIFPLDEL